MCKDHVNTQSSCCIPFWVKYKIKIQCLKHQLNLKQKNTNDKPAVAEPQQALVEESAAWDTVEEVLAVVVNELEL